MEILGIPLRSLILPLVFIIWLVLTVFVLPRLGVPT